DPLPWATVGDAAHLVDPITGEGLYYALRSGELLAQAWSSHGPSYTELLQRELIPELEAAAAIAQRFYRGRFLGDSILERMALFAARSRRFRQLLCDLFAGSQGYLDLRPASTASSPPRCSSSQPIHEPQPLCIPPAPRRVPHPRRRGLARPQLPRRRRQPALVRARLGRLPLRRGWQPLPRLHRFLGRAPVRPRPSRRHRRHHRRRRPRLELRRFLPR